jgi:multicomponent Na+:H+ antiporter subunit B
MEIFYALLIFMIIAAIVAVETQKLLSSVICVGAIGFGASLMFLFLRAPDIAITQIVVEVLGLIILIRATIARDLTLITGDREFFAVVVSIVIVFIIFLAGVKVFESLPLFGEPIFVRYQKPISAMGSGRPGPQTSSLR